MVCLALSAVSGFWALYLKFFEQTSLVQTPLPLLFVMTGITGTMCILMGLLAELMTRTYHESQDKPIYSVSNIRNIDAASVVALPSAIRSATRGRATRSTDDRILRATAEPSAWSDETLDEESLELESRRP
jgi:hypothetical protein